MAHQNAQEKNNYNLNLDLLLIGKSGHGKTSTGNSILDRKEFTASKKTGTLNYQVGCTRIDDRDIKVMDIPGLYDPSFESMEASVNHFIETTDNHFKHSPSGFDAMILVLSYTARMTEEEKDAIKALKSILGQDVVRNHTVCVLTHGDSFLNDYEDDDKDFKAWCQERDVYRELFEECESRFVLFDNMTRDPNEKKAQLNELISKIDSLKDKHSRYTIGNFEAAKKTREELRMELKLPLILESLSKEIKSIKTDLEQVARDGSFGELRKLKTRILDLISKVPETRDPKIVNLRKEIQDQHNFIIGYETIFVDQEKGRLETERIKKDLERTRKENEEMVQQQQRRGLEQQNERRRVVETRPREQTRADDSCCNVL